MRGRDRFNADETGWIREQLLQLRVAERDEQKRIRARLRRAEFRISDCATDSHGFTASDFDGLVASRRIDEAPGSYRSALSQSTSACLAVGSAPGSKPNFRVAIAALTAPRHDDGELIWSAEVGREPVALLDRPRN